MSTLFAITKTIFRVKNTIYLEIIVWDPSIYTMDHPKLIVSNQKKSLLVHKGLSRTNLSFPFFPSLALLLFSLSALGLFLKHNVFFIYRWAKIFQRKNVNIFLPIILSICFGCSKEPSHWDGSFEHPQHMFWLRNKKIIFCCTLLTKGMGLTSHQQLWSCLDGQLT